MQTYLMSEELTVEQKRTIFLCRIRMAVFAENYRASSDSVTPCIVCKSHRDCLSHAVQCHETLKRVKARENYHISRHSAIMLQEISKVRKSVQLQ